MAFANSRLLITPALDFYMRICKRGMGVPEIFTYIAKNPLPKKKKPDV